MTIERKVVAITGAGRGIGRAIALQLAARGARVVLGARSEADIEAVAREIEAADGQAAYIATDGHPAGRSPRSGRPRLPRIRPARCHGQQCRHRPDLALRCASMRFDALRVEDWDATIDVNIKGVLYGIAAALPIFERQKSGHVVNILSTAGLKILPTMGVYAATKNAIRTATEALRQEAGPHLRVTEVSPGFVDTEFAASIGDPEIRAAIERRKREIATLLASAYPFDPSWSLTASAASHLPGVSRGVWTAPREAARTRRACGIRTP